MSEIHVMVDDKQVSVRFRVVVLQGGKSFWLFAQWFRVRLSDDSGLGPRDGAKAQH